MGDERQLLLAAIVFTALYYKVTADNERLLEVTPDVVDDQYDGCRDQALTTFIYSGLLEQELNHSKEFQKAWSANTQCSKLIPGGIKEHTAALLAYARGDINFIQTFNRAVETLGVNVSTYENNFHFKSLHFLLMDSIRLLSQKECKTVHRLSDQTYTQLELSSKVRFGSFTKVYSSYSELKRFNDLEDQVLFNITSCFFANLGNNICNSDEDEGLLSPAEVFTVEEEVKKKTEDDNEYTEIVLKHLKLESSHNCYIFSRSPADMSTQWLVLVLVALSLLFFNC